MHINTTFLVELIVYYSLVVYMSYLLIIAHFTALQHGHLCKRVNSANFIFGYSIRNVRNSKKSIMHLIL